MSTDTTEGEINGDELDKLRELYGRAVKEVNAEDARAANMDPKDMIVTGSSREL